MRKTLISLMVAVACERAAPARVDSSTVTQTSSAVVQAGVDSSDELPDIEAPDSSVKGWKITAPGEAQSTSFFRGGYVRHPSGLFTLWVDTAIRATEDQPVRRLHADSVVVRDLRHGERVTRICTIDNRVIDDVVAVLPDTEPARPRLAWVVGPGKLRISRFPTDSLLCRTYWPDEEVDDGG